MQQSTEPQPSCSCIATLFPPNEVFFLTRKPTPNDSPTHTRNRSSELRLEGEGKPAKRSLRKRPASNHCLPSGSEPLPFSLLGEHTGMPVWRPPTGEVWKEAGDAANDYSFSIIEDLPPSTARQSQQHSPSYHHHQQLTMPLLLPTPFDLQPPNRTSPPRHPVSLPLVPLLFNNEPEASQGSNYADHGSPQREAVAKVHYPVRGEQQESESWIPGREEELLIEDFDRLFLNRVEHQSQANLADYRHAKAREAKRSKRQEKQLVGRMAESDDEACSESAPSQVIGKGFDNHLLPFWENEEGPHFEKTLATRSTNTKLSHWLRPDQANSPGYHFRSDTHI